jgi:hypothetical protein
MSGPSNETNPTGPRGRERRPSAKVVKLSQYPYSVPLVTSPHLTYTFTAEESQEKEDAKRKAAERAEERKKKKAVVQQKAAQRKQAGGRNRRKGKLVTLVFRCALYVVLTVSSNYQN